MAKNGEKNKTTAAGTQAAAPAGNGGAAHGHDEGMSDWHGKFGGNVDGWWSPEETGTHTLVGILSNFIDKARSEKLQSNTLVFELTEACAGVKNGGSEQMPGEKGDNKLHTAPIGCMIGVPEWKQLEGMWPKKAGHKVIITRGEKRSIGKGRSMYDVKIRMSNNVIKEIEVFEEEPVDAGAEPVGGMAPEERFQVEGA